MSHLGMEVNYTTVIKFRVLILVVMDVALGHMENMYIKVAKKTVLILVVMDVALGQVFSQTLRNQ